MTKQFIIFGGWDAKIKEKRIREIWKQKEEPEVGKDGKPVMGKDGKPKMKKVQGPRKDTWYDTKEQKVEEVAQNQGDSCTLVENVAKLIAGKLEPQMEKMAAAKGK